MDRMFKDYSKFASSNCGVNPLTLNDYAKTQDVYLNPTIIEERKLNVAQMDVFSRLMMDRILVFSDIGHAGLHVIIIDQTFAGKSPLCL